MTEPIFSTIGRKPGPPRQPANCHRLIGATWSTLSDIVLGCRALKIEPEPKAYVQVVHFEMGSQGKEEKRERGRVDTMVHY